MSKQTPARKTTATGFTLIELMIAVAIVGILATIAAVSYSTQIQKSRRTDARSALLDLAGREEKLFSTTNAYGATPALLGYGSSTAAFTAVPVGNYYAVTVTVGAPPVSYLITATPTGSQANDTTCTSLTLDQTGLQGATPAANAATCWGR